MATYRLADEIGRGALGRVARVVELDSGRSYAGKILHDSFRDDPGATERFAREARLLEGLEHQNIVRVHDLVVIEGRQVIVMELVEGPSLQTLLAREGPLPQARLVRIARGIAQGLGAAHHRGLVHRDLKPANVLVAPGDVAKLVDFGLARASSMIGVDRNAFALVGTPDYMAPESLDPLALDSRSDLYALGCVLHELTTGSPPFGGATAFAILEAHRRLPLPELPSGPERSPDLVALIQALLAKSPADRPQSAASVVDALDGLAFEDARALELSGPKALLPAAPGCAACGALLVEQLPVCFGCGLVMAALERGHHSVFVVGPGRVADKLDAFLRQALVDWLRGSPALALDPEPMANKLPRLPFLLVSEIDADSAQTLAQGLRGLGLEVEVRQGGPFALREMRKKAWKLSGRATVVVTTSLISLLHGLVRLPAPALAGAVAVLMATVSGIGWVSATRKVTRPRERRRRFSPALERALAAVVAAVPALAVRRHRETLRGVLTRVLALRQAFGREGSALEDELALVVGAATQTSLSLDRLEEELGQSDLREPDASARARLQERDLMAARLLETTARLEALRSRLALAQARPVAGARADTLRELRAQVEALEDLARP